MRAGAAGGPYADLESEFWYNVMPQAEMPIAGEIETDFDVDRIASFLTSAARGTPADFQGNLRSTLLKDPSIFHDLRQLLGISDKRAYLELSYLASRTEHPSGRTGLCGCRPWNMARHPLEFFLRLADSGSPEAVRRKMVDVLVEYLLVEGLASAAQGFSGLRADQLAAIYTALVGPREVQQKAAKRRGHGCEAALARVIHACGVRFLPEDKHINPMGAKDPNLDRSTLAIAPKQRGRTFSFDMLIMDGTALRVAIQSLIHTSDPGQYGVNKSDETVAVAEQIHAANRRSLTARPVELWGLVDGIGFSENKADTINKMLAHFDHFIQLNTLYKAPLRLHLLGLCRLMAISFSNRYTRTDIDAISQRYVPRGVAVVSDSQRLDPRWTAIHAGLATIYIVTESGPHRSLRSGERRFGAI